MKILATLITITRYLEVKFDYGYFILFYQYGFMILHKKFQVILSKIEGVTVIYAIFIFFIFLSMFKFQGLDIVTILGDEGLQ